MSARHVIRSAAVLGAGTMGAQLAAHLANAGLTTLLLDVDSATAQTGFERLLGTTPDPFFTPDCVARISVGSFDTDFERIGRCDWIIEAVVEQLDSKRALLERVDAHRADGSIVSSNTSGLSIRAMAEGRRPGTGAASDQCEGFLHRFQLGWILLHTRGLHATGHVGVFQAGPGDYADCALALKMQTALG